MKRGRSKGANPAPNLFDASKKGGEEIVEGVVERISFVNEESGWSVIRLEIPGKKGLMAAVGTLPGVQPGESLRLHGQWVRDRRFGEQFKVDSFVPVQPSTLAGIEKYLGSGLIRGIGRVNAGRLVRHFGLDTFDVIEHHPERLTEVKGIGTGRQKQITVAWKEQRAVKDVMLFLQSHGVTPAYAVRIYRRYGNRAISLVKENPFRLAVDIPGIGFRTADRISSTLGITPESPQRAEAGVLHTLGELADEGNLFAPREKLVRQAADLLGIDEGLVESAVDRLPRQGLTVVESAVKGEPVYLADLYAVEVGAAKRLREILDHPSTGLEIDVERALEWFEEQVGMHLAGPQREAVRRAIGGKALVITGGPGTGKTTIIDAIVRILGRKGRRILMCAPTGRAAKRMEEATGREAKTIHRLLEFNPRRQRFERDGSRPLAADLIVVDEMSMIDAALFAALLQAVPRSCQLLFVGDPDQLPSVGPGNVLHDLISSRALEVVALTEIFRQARESLIVVNAHRINRGEAPILSGDEWEEPDFFFIPKEDPLEVVEILKEIVLRRIPSRFGVDPIDDIQVLTPMRRGELGVVNLNSVLQELLNPDGETIERGSRLFRVGDKVMQIRNNYDLGVFNGDLGRVISVDREERRMTVRFDERSATYDWSDLDELALGYACSIHKAQGSEYPVVVIPLHTQHYALLQRNLLYTGITRGRRLVVVIGMRRAVDIAVGNNRVRGRHTRLAARLAFGGGGS